MILTAQVLSQIENDLLADARSLLISWSADASEVALSSSVRAHAVLQVDKADRYTGFAPVVKFLQADWVNLREVILMAGQDASSAEYRRIIELIAERRARLMVKGQAA
ncbi:hypothetical protein XM25_07915 [Devosia sp. H5989]|nr:hypothetical protein XM25_07915 [Devosia sp. H5989]